MPDECAFCPSTANFTGEHVWGDWINTVLTNRTFEFRRVDLKTLRVKSWKSKELNLKANVVCGKCNSGWMSRIDRDDAMPVLRHLITNPSKRTLPLRWIISLGLFAFKTAVVADHMAIRGTPFFTREQRHNFARTLQVPGGVFMWLATLEHQTHGAFKTRTVVPQTVFKDDFRLYVFTYAVGHFILQVVGAKWTTDDPKRYFRFPVIDQNPRDDFVSTSFWPIPISDPPRIFVWPPSSYLAESHINEFADRWAKLQLIE
ncbi:MAG TPA: hypothetical protein VGF20_10955 [Candidatus Acidoferrum sp.]|jgi:hypothetical protein